MSQPEFIVTLGFGGRFRQALHFSTAVKIGDRAETIGEDGRNDDLQIPQLIEKEITVAFGNIKRVLAAAGATWAHSDPRQHLSYSSLTAMLPTEPAQFCDIGRTLPSSDERARCVQIGDDIDEPRHCLQLLDRSGIKGGVRADKSTCSEFLVAAVNCIEQAKHLREKHGKLERLSARIKRRAAAPQELRIPRHLPLATDDGPLPRGRLN